ncbi:MAG: hypothetical protein TR69_WS6001000078 [candidate division WS6 bacterium OLB20]|uniref:Uncharacterized protein n=1 Tax=candidate division WS6 bacterium OLB20 TaxID=1617426 RepID=A0A136M156_9BACT|nr:MAG: hypothetical protein TR69_WS6001000078 [candidate division WS6 bacterium OLB20]
MEYDVQQTIIYLTKLAVSRESGYSPDDHGLAKEHEYGLFGAVSKGISSGLSRVFPINSTGIYTVGWGQPAVEMSTDHLRQMSVNGDVLIDRVITNLELMLADYLQNHYGEDNTGGQLTSKLEAASRHISHIEGIEYLFSAKEQIFNGSSTAGAALRLISEGIFRDLGEHSQQHLLGESLALSAGAVYQLASLEKHSINDVLENLRILNAFSISIVSRIPEEKPVYTLSAEAEELIAKVTAEHETGNNYHQIGCPFSYGTIPFMLKRCAIAYKLAFS